QAHKAFHLVCYSHFSPEFSIRFLSFHPSLLTVSFASVSSNFLQCVCVCVCVVVCVCVCSHASVYECMFTDTSKADRHWAVCMCTECVCLHVCVYVCASLCIYACVRMRKRQREKLCGCVCFRCVMLW